MHALLILTFLCYVEATVFQYTGLYSAWAHSYGKIFPASNQCPKSAQGKSYKGRCTGDPAHSPEAEQEFLHLLNVSNSTHPKLTPDQMEALREVWPVKLPNGTVYRNVYCAKCNLGAAFNGKDIERIPAMLACETYTLPFSCYLDLYFGPEGFYEGDGGIVMAGRPRWDGFFLPDDDYLDLESHDIKVGDDFIEILQWAACVFSFIALIVAICVYGSSKVLIRPLPGKMMFALCCSLIGTLLAFAFSVLTSEIVVNHRWICLISAALMPAALLATFTWMALFGVELLKTFGVLDSIKKCRVGP